MSQDSVRPLREPSLADALVPLVALATVPYAVFCYASPALSVIFGFTGFRIEKTTPTELEERS